MTWLWNWLNEAPALVRELRSSLGMLGVTQVDVPLDLAQNLVRLSTLRCCPEAVVVDVDDELRRGCRQKRSSKSIDGVFVERAGSAKSWRSASEPSTTCSRRSDANSSFSLMEAGLVEGPAAGRAFKSGRRDQRWARLRHWHRLLSQPVPRRYIDDGVVGRFQEPRLNGLKPEVANSPHRQPRHKFEELRLVDVCPVSERFGSAF